MAQVGDAFFVLDGRRMVLGSVAIFFLDLFPVWLIAQYLLELVNCSELRAYRRWGQWMIYQGFLQVKMVFMQNFVVDDGCGV